MRNLLERLLTPRGGPGDLAAPAIGLAVLWFVGFALMSLAWDAAPGLAALLSRALGASGGGCAA